MIVPNAFVNGDCMDYLKEYPDNYFDLAVVDPPYGDGGGAFKGKGGSRFGGRFDKYKPEKPIDRTGGGLAKKYCRDIIKWDVPPAKEYFDELFRVSKNQIIWGGNYFSLPPTRCFLIWRKLSISESFSMSMAEYAWTSFNDNAKVFECEPQGTVEAPRFHPTQKPIRLYNWIMNRYAKPGDVILDTHAGSASCLIAARETGHKYVGFEINPGYYEKAKKRLDAATTQQNIFDYLEGATDGTDR